jgi:MoaA/NifB/PqqE/SkfB family radical SAM enzyme
MSQDAESMLGGGELEAAILSRLKGDRASVAPPLPEKIAIEINNSCNHKCFFCPNPTMERARRVMDPATVLRILEDAYANGLRQVSFYSTGEPLLNKSIPDYIRQAKRLGFAYVFLSTNGGRAVKDRLEAVLDAGLDSLKFSVNAGNRETYALVHGEDDFETVIEHIRFVDRYRRTVRPIKLFVSFVETAISAPSFEQLRARLGGMVDEIARYPFVVIGTPLKKRIETNGSERPYVGYEHVDRGLDLNKWRTSLPCYQLWSYLNVTVEGYLSACCSDFNDDLIVGNLNKMSLLDAWHSPEFKELRQRHLNRRVAGTLCASCVAQKLLPYEPINRHLHDGSAT